MYWEQDNVRTADWLQGILATGRLKILQVYGTCTHTHTHMYTHIQVASVSDYYYAPPPPHTHLHVHTHRHTHMHTHQSHGLFQPYLNSGIESIYDCGIPKMQIYECVHKCSLQPEPQSSKLPEAKPFYSASAVVITL